jgi:ATP-dependent DNA helicase RecQ
LLIKERPERKAKKKRGAGKAAKGKKRAAAGDPAVDALKKWRMGVAKKEGVPPFRVLTDKALEEIVAERPASEDELLTISGVGPRTASRYGAAILRVLAADGRN